MIKEIMKDEFFLKQPSTIATKDDLAIIVDLKDTLNNHRDKCVGMAANMIGYSKCIIAFIDHEEIKIMINPEIIKANEQYNTEEGCLSLVGVRPTKRYQKIKVKYFDDNFKIKIKTYTGFTAQIIQHEIDHCAGIII